MRRAHTYVIYIAVIVLMMFLANLSVRRAVLQPNLQAPFGDLTRDEQFVPISPHSCITTATFYGGVKTTICVKPLSMDGFISGHILRGGAYEFEIVNSVVKAMTVYSDATFVDIGCNMGMYTTVVAAMGRQVICVDADSINPAYVWHSLKQTNNTGRVRLLHNSVSDDHTVLYPVGKHTGATSMKTAEQIKKINEKNIGPPVASVTMMDILGSITTKNIIIKMDIEAYECKALRPDVLLGGSGKNIAMIFMEWSHVKGNKATCPDFETWLESFYQGGYTPHKPKTLEAVSKSEVNKQANLAWVHRDAKLEDILALY